MRVLLSIKPEFAERIFDGSKRYEFRRAIFKNPDIKIVVVYASSPVQLVIGAFEIEPIDIEVFGKIRSSKLNIPFQIIFNSEGIA